MLPASAKNKIEQIWLDVIAGGVSQPTEVIEQLTYLMFAKQLDEVAFIREKIGAYDSYNNSLAKPKASITKDLEDFNKDLNKVEKKIKARLKKEAKKAAKAQPQK